MPVIEGEFDAGERLTYCEMEIEIPVRPGVMLLAPLKFKEKAVSVSNPESLRVKLWREQNRQRYNAYMRNYQKERRGKSGSAVTAQVHTPGLPDAVLGGDGGGEKEGGAG